MFGEQGEVVEGFHVETGFGESAGVVTAVEAKVVALIVELFSQFGCIDVRVFKGLLEAEVLRDE